MIDKGKEWGVPSTSSPDHEVHGDDPTLAAVIARAPGALVRFLPAPTSDLARAVGLGARDAAGPLPRTALAMDALALGAGVVAVNMVVLGTPPDRLTWFSRRHDVRIVVDGRLWFDGGATTVVIAVGQWLRGKDVVPRGHPGDGRVEVQVYRLDRSQRRAMRRRLAAGTHVPHPRITVGTARALEVSSRSPLPLEVDGRGRSGVADLAAEVRPSAYRLLV